MPPTPGTNRDDPNRNQAENEDVEYMDSPQFIVAGGSSDEEDSDDGMMDNGGYQPLAQDPSAVDSDEDVDVEMGDEGASGGSVPQLLNITSNNSSSNTPDFGKVGLGPNFQPLELDSFQIPEVKNTEADDRRTLWQEVKSDHEPLDQEQVEKIKSAMSSITLPKLAIPEWARVMPEEEWKNRLFARLHANTTTSAVEEQSKTEAASSPTTEKTEDSKSDNEEKT